MNKKTIEFLHQVCYVFSGLLYPPRCVICDRILVLSVSARHAACPECLKKLHWIRGPVCMKCGRTVRSEQQEYCEDCGRYPHLFERGISVLPYDDLMRRSVNRMKNGRRKAYLAEYASWMTARISPFLKIWKPDCVVPVPMHWKKKRLRGYNPSELLAASVAEASGIPYRNLLKKRRATGEQKQLNRRQRRHNLDGAFCVSEPVRDIRSVLLVDDVYTTGSTVDECAAVLKKAGIPEVYVLTLCIGGTDAGGIC